MYIYIRLNMYIYIYINLYIYIYIIFMYIWGFFNKQYNVFILPKNFVEVLIRWKKFFRCLILPRVLGK